MGKYLSDNFVSQKFEEEGYKKLDVYENAHKLISCICPKGHEIKIAWMAFNRGIRCSFCHGNARLKYDDVVKQFSDNGCTLLEEEYINSITPMRFLCTCGKESKVRWGDFQQGRRQCKECGYDKGCRGSNSPRWKSDREKCRLIRLCARKAHDALKSTLRYLGKRKDFKSQAILGYSPQDLWDRLKSCPSWDDVKDKNWSLDHIFPIKAFVDYNITDIRVINSLDNLQPMILEDNISKGDKYDDEKFKEWIKKHGFIQSNFYINMGD